MSKYSSISLSQVFCLQLLKIFIASGSSPVYSKDMSIPSIVTFISKHHLCLIFLSILKQNKQYELAVLLEHKASSLLKRHLVTLRSLVELTRAFHSVSIDPLILKGIPLNSQLYGQECLRESKDIDVLILPQQLLAAHACLSELGYQLASPFSIDDLLGDYHFLMKYMDEILYWHPLNTIYIDLKWHISSIDAMFPWYDPIKTVKINVLSESITVLNPEQNFFYLCDHAAKHGWERLKWLVDLAKFHQKIPFCWQTVITLATKAKSTRSLLEASILLDRLFLIKVGTVPHSWWDKAIVLTRLYFVQRQWLNKDQWIVRKYTKIIYYFLLIFMLYPRTSQKFNYLVNLFLRRKQALKQIGQLSRPSPFKMIIKSFFCWEKI